MQTYVHMHILRMRQKPFSCGIHPACRLLSKCDMLAIIIMKMYLSCPSAASLKLQEQVGSLQSDSVKDDGEKKTKKKKKKEQSTTTTNGVISAGTGGESVKSGGEARREVQSKILEPPTKMKRTPSSESKHI